MGKPRAAHVGCAFVVVVALACLVADPTPAAPPDGRAPGSLPASSRSAMADAPPVPTAPATAPTVPSLSADQPPDAALTGPAVAAAPAARLESHEPASVTMSFTGDTLMHSPIVARAAANAGGAGYDFRPM